jgi:hypothetical protein
MNSGERYTEVMIERFTHSDELVVHRIRIDDVLARCGDVHEQRNGDGELIPIITALLLDRWLLPSGSSSRQIALVMLNGGGRCVLGLKVCVANEPRHGTKEDKGDLRKAGDHREAKHEAGGNHERLGLRQELLANVTTQRAAFLFIAHTGHNHSRRDGDQQRRDL